MALEPPYIVEAAYSLDAGAEAVKRLARLDPRPTAVVCGNDVLAAGAILGLRELGIVVPDAISVVGYDDIDLADVATPALTTVHVPHRRMGKAAAELLLGMIRSVEVETQCRAGDQHHAAFFSGPRGGCRTKRRLGMKCWRRREFE